jgi:hypothetical protein
MMTNNPDQQARRPLLQPSIGYSLRQLGKTPVIPLLDRRPPLLTEEAFIVMLLPTSLNARSRLCALRRIGALLGLPVQ